MRFFIYGSALRDQPDHVTLGDARFLAAVRTASRYRLHSVRDEHPGAFEVESGGTSFVGELYELTPEQHTYLLAHEPPGLYEGPVILEDGTIASAMLYPKEVIAERGYSDISHFGGWAAYKEYLKQQ